MEPSFKITGKLWIYPGMGAWHFLTVDKKTSKTIKSITSHLRRGFGSVKISAQVGKTKWQTSIFPTKDGEFLLPVKSSVRKVENLQADKKTTIQITII